MPRGVIRARVPVQTGDSKCHHPVCGGRGDLRHDQADRRPRCHHAGRNAGVQPGDLRPDAGGDGAERPHLRPVLDIHERSAPGRLRRVLHLPRAGRQPHRVSLPRHPPAHGRRAGDLPGSGYNYGRAHGGQEGHLVRQVRKGLRSRGTGRSVLLDRDHAYRRVRRQLQNLALRRIRLSPAAYHAGLGRRARPYRRPPAPHSVQHAQRLG